MDIKTNLKSHGPHATSVANANSLTDDKHEDESKIGVTVKSHRQIGQTQAK